MENLTPEQVANFVYWISESHDLRGVLHKVNPTPEAKLKHIETILLPLFLKKYPGGILTGFEKPVCKQSDNDVDYKCEGCHPDCTDCI